MNTNTSVVKGDKLENPFAFKFNDEKMKKEHAPQYLPPKKR